MSTQPVKNKRVGILQSNYIPWKGYFDLIDKTDVFVIYDEVQYTKNDWRNRNRIKTKNGLEWITIPVQRNSLSQRIDQTLVAKRDWNTKHWKTLVTNYTKASAFAETKEFLYDLYFGEPRYDNLSEINCNLIRKISDYLGIKTSIINSTDLEMKGDRNEKLVDACLKLDADRYLSGPSAKSYLNVQLFNDNGISVEWMDYHGYASYTQLFPPFVHEVSIIDLIFNMGTSSRAYFRGEK